jgi:ParB family chromosome partitioning protein
MSNIEGAVSLKILAERHVDGVSKSTQFKLDPRIVEVEAGFNARPLDRAHIDAMKLAFKSGAVFPPIFVRVDNGRIILVDGHHRTTAFNELIAEGIEIQSVDAIQFRGNDADRVAHMLTSAQGLPLTPLEMGLSYRRLIGFGWDVKQIAAKVGKTASHVGEMIKLAESNSDVQRMVASKQVSASNAVKMIRKHGEKAGPVMARHLETAKSAGKAKVTAKTIQGDTMPLAKAIQAEIDSAGTVRAETLCPEHAPLIAYLRNSNTIKQLAAEVCAL